MTTTHPDRLRPEQLVDHIQDALAEHLGLRSGELWKGDKHTLYLTNQPDPSTYQVFRISIDIEELERDR